MGLECALCSKSSSDRLMGRAGSGSPAFCMMLFPSSPSPSACEQNSAPPPSAHVCKARQCCTCMRMRVWMRPPAPRFNSRGAAWRREESSRAKARDAWSLAHAVAMDEACVGTVAVACLLGG